MKQNWHHVVAVLFVAAVSAFVAAIVVTVLVALSHWYPGPFIAVLSAIVAALAIRFAVKQINHWF